MKHGSDTCNDGQEGGLTPRRAFVSEAEPGDAGRVGPGDGPLGLTGGPACPGGAGGLSSGRRDAPGGPRGAYVLQAVEGFMRGKGGRKPSRHSTGLAQAGVKRENVQACLEFRAWTR